MNEFSVISELLERKSGQRAVLITLRDVEGSSYRKPGARMVVAQDGEAAGAVSGGCLETTLRAHAIESIDAGPHTLVIDTTVDSDLVFGHGLGCPGKLRFLVEPFEVDSEPQSLAAWRATVRDRARRVVLTRFDDEGRPVRTSTIHARPSGTGEEIDCDMHSLAWESVRSRFIRAKGSEWFVGVIEHPVRLFLIGSGLDVPPFIRLAEAAGFEAIQVARTSPLDTACRISTPEDITALAIDSRTAVIVMTHNFLQDLDYLRALIGTSPMYIGVIGSKDRFERLMSDLEAEGVTRDRLRQIAGPAGLDIGAESPTEIALSVLAEVQGIAGGKPRIRQDERARSGIAPE